MLKIILTFMLIPVFINAEILERLNKNYFDSITIDTNNIYVSFRNQSIRYGISLGMNTDDFDFRYNIYGEKLYLPRDTVVKFSERNSRIIFKPLKLEYIEIVKKLSIDSIPVLPANYIYFRETVKREIEEIEELYYVKSTSKLIEYLLINNIIYYRYKKGLIVPISNKKITR